MRLLAIDNRYDGVAGSSSTISNTSNMLDGSASARPTAPGRFASGGSSSMNTPCVVHPGWRDKDGYVRAKVAGGRRVFVHRFAWESAHGSIPPGMVVCHHCDNPPCVNPDHLFLGTNAENLEDMTRKGRRTRGDTHGMSRLSEADIPVIRSLRAAGVALSVVAARYGVSITTISRVATGKTWRHVA